MAAAAKTLAAAGAEPPALLANSTLANNNNIAATATATNKTAAGPPPPSRPENMLPIMIVLGIMFVGICIAMNLFSRARFKKQRSRAFASAATAGPPRALTPSSNRRPTTPRPGGGSGSQLAAPGAGSRLGGARSAGHSPMPPSSRSASTCEPPGARRHSITLSCQAARAAHYSERSPEDNV